MRVTSLEEMVQMPKYTLYAEYEPCIIGDLRIKKSSPGEERWIYSDLFSVELKEDQHIHDVLLDGSNVGDNISIDFEESYRSDIYSKKQLFVVFLDKEIESIANNLDRLVERKNTLEVIYK